MDTWNIISVTFGGTTFSGTAIPLTLEGDISTLGFMINGWYDFDTGTKWVPFIGGGVGVAKVNIDIESISGIANTYDESDTVLAYQFGAGIGYKLTPTVTANLSYRYFWNRRSRVRRWNRQNRLRRWKLKHHGWYLCSLLAETRIRKWCLR